MVSLDPLTGDQPSSTSLVPLENTSGEERCIPPDWLGEGNIPVNKKFLQYVRPLVGSIDTHITQLGVAITQ